MIGKINSEVSEFKPPVKSKGSNAKTKDVLNSVDWIEVAKVGVIVIGGIVIIKELSAFLKRFGDSEEEKEEKQGQEVKSDLDQLATLGVFPSYSDTAFNQYANRLYNAQFSFFGTDEAAFYNVFKLMQNKADVLKLIEAYGFRRIEWTTIRGSLSEMMQSELNQSEIDRCNNILASNGINYRF